jgi:Ser/Thr protein kinase RdoA (MazF antagonist)
VNRARLRKLGFELRARAEAGVSDEGAWFATAPDGAPVVLKWFPDETMAERYAVLLPGLDELRSRGVPVPEYPHVLAVDGWTLAAQQVLPGASVRNPSRAMVEQVVECVAAMGGVACPLPAPDLRPWGASVAHTLTVGVDGWAMHEPLRTGGRRSAAVLDRVEAVGANADPAWFPTDGLVHLDLHTDNILAGDDGTLTGIIDWGGCVRRRSPLRSRQVRLRPRRARSTGLGRRRGHRHRAARDSSVRRPPRAAVHVLADPPPHR